MSNSYSQLLRQWQDYVMLVGLSMLLAILGYMVVTGPWDDPLAAIIMYGMLALMIVVPFTPWFGLLKERWNDGR